MKKPVLFNVATLMIFGLLNLVQNPPFLSPGPDNDQQQAITSILNDFIEGANSKDLTRLRSAFAKEAAVMFVRDEALVPIELEDFFKNVTAGDVIVERQVLVIDTFGNAAQAKVESVFPDGVAIDYLSLLKFDGRWKIVNKIFSFV
ncbi:nuclear transport factor 2 family protein, partial [bacterium]|nr:nuclear transport factor 2 family protein [bacterium]